MHILILDESHQKPADITHKRWYAKPTTIREIPPRGGSVEELLGRRLGFVSRDIAPTLIIVRETNTIVAVLELVPLILPKNDLPPLITRTRGTSCKHVWLG